MINGQLNGPTFLKVIITASHIDTRATVSHIRTNLTNLDDYFQSNRSNIQKFNHYVKGQRSALAARGEQTQDLLVNLFKAYEKASDATFGSYITAKKDEYEDGRDLTADQLMQFAKNKYDALVQGSPWIAPTEHELKLVALTAELKTLQDKNKKLEKKLKGKDNNQRRITKSTLGRKSLLAPENRRPRSGTGKSTTVVPTTRPGRSTRKRTAKRQAILKRAIRHQMKDLRSTLLSPTLQSREQPSWRNESSVGGRESPSADHQSSGSP